MNDRNDTATQATADQRLLTTGQAARYLNCSTAFIRKLLSNGKLKGINLGLGEARRAWRVDRLELDRLIANLSGTGR